IEGNWYHRSSINFSASGSPLTAIGDTNLLGASIGLRIDARMEVAIFCKDCNNQLVPSYLAFDPLDANVFNKASIMQTFDYNSIRTIGASLNYKF
ncbi:MAG: TonB-dependent receptor, partial [Alphaproteobacteria bacterium]|nr:TonB-dependent receptor [Alphaproteobacteria bacterium]